jgi:hypothetical protein
MRQYCIQKRLSGFPEGRFSFYEVLFFDKFILTIKKPPWYNTGEKPIFAMEVFMKKSILALLYGVLVITALAGVAAAVVLYPTHGANGTSVGYFTMVLFPTAFLLLGLAGIFFRYWLVTVLSSWAGLAGYLLFSESGGLWPFLLCIVYLLLSLSAGVCGTALWKMRTHKEQNQSPSPK